jgi:hypothetical protein
MMCHSVWYMHVQWKIQVGHSICDCMAIAVYTLFVCWRVLYAYICVSENSSAVSCNTGGSRSVVKA